MKPLVHCTGTGDPSTSDGGKKTGVNTLLLGCNFPVLGSTAFQAIQKIDAANAVVKASGLPGSQSPEPVVWLLAHAMAQGPSFKLAACAWDRDAYTPNDRYFSFLSRPVDNSDESGAGRVTCRAGSEAQRMAYGNMFHLLHERLSDDAGWVLQLVHDTRGAQLHELKAELARANIDQVPARLTELEALGLVVCVDEVWKTTWTGAGVSNWRTQLHCAEEGQAVAEPREGENGHQPGPECSEYRAALFAPGYCWCCRPRKHHASEAVRAAQRLLKR